MRADRRGEIFSEMKTTQYKSIRVCVTDAVVFDWILLIGFIVLAVVSVNYNARARSIPMALGVIGSVMIFFQLLVDMFPRLRGVFRFVGEGGLLSGQERQSKDEVAGSDRNTQTLPGMAQEGKIRDDAAEWFKVLRLILWIAGFILLLGLTHYLIAVGMFVVLVTRLEAKESWTKSVVLAACVNIGFFILFDLILNAQL
jgi:hypothetical protein